MRKRAISFTLPKALKVEMKEHFTKKGYSFRRKSEWVKEMVRRLLQIKGYEELISSSDAIIAYNLDLTDTIQADSILLQNIEDAVIAVRSQYPTLEGVQSKIIRTAIMQGIEYLDYPSWDGQQDTTASEFLN